MSGPRIVGLFEGYGGLTMGIQQVLGGDLAAYAEIEPAMVKLLAHYHPDVPNLGDVSAVDWTSWRGRVDVMSGGFPCQDVSLAGLRRGLKAGTRSGLWSEFARAIDVARPGLVVIENVRGLLSAEAARNMEPDPWAVGDGPDGPALRALGAVLGDLAELGYDTRWCGLRAADAGAPHGRYRVFIVAYPAGQPWGVGDGDDVRVGGAAVGRAPHAGAGSNAADADCERQQRHRDARGRWCRPPHNSVPVADPRGERFGQHPGAASAEEARTAGGHIADGDGGSRPDQDWGPYRPAVERWERVLGRVAPAPTNPDGRGGAHRLAPEFVEWMMGLPAGHVTAPNIGLSRAQQLKALGNGVVRQQAALAVRTLLERVSA